MRELCREQGLPEPRFAEESGGFQVVFAKDRFTPEQLRAMGLTDDRVRVVLLAKQQPRVTNQQVQQLLGVSRQTASRCLDELVSRQLLRRRGRTGRATHYVLNASQTPQTPQKRPTNAPDDT